MASRPAALAVGALVVLAPVLAACGGGSKNSAQPLPTPPTLTVPGQTGTPSVPQTAGTGATGATGPSTTSTITTTPTTTTQSNPSTPQGGAAPPQTGGASPGQTTKTTTAPAGSPAQKFEQFCKDNPGAC
jgi:hypothetical protein